MAARRFLTTARARGLAVALVVNGALLALLAIGTPGSLRLKSEAPSRIVLLNMLRLAPRRPVEPKSKPAAKSPSDRPPPPPPRRAPVETSAPAASPAPQAPATPSAPVAAPSASTVQSGASEKSAAAMRHLLGRGAFVAGRRRDGEGCETQRNGDLGHIDGLTPEKRLGLGLSGPMRRDELVDTNRELQTQLGPPRGNAARFGCNLKGGKWKCSTY